MGRLSLATTRCSGEVADWRLFVKYLVSSESCYEFNLYTENKVEKISDKKAKKIEREYDFYDDDQGTQWGSDICDTLEDLIMYLRQEKMHYMNFTVNLDALPDQEQLIVARCLSCWDIPNDKSMIEKMVAFYSDQKYDGAIFAG